MPHLHFEYSPGLENCVDLGAFAAALRDAMVASGVFPLGGVRVRGFRADVACVADGAGHHFVDMVLRIGQGRDAATRERAADRIYDAARKALEPQITMPFMLSLEVQEISRRFSRKDWNTVHAAVSGARRSR